MIVVDEKTLEMLKQQTAREKEFYEDYAAKVTNADRECYAKQMSEIRSFFSVLNLDK